MSAALLLTVLVGFSPTLYLRAYFDVPDISGSVWAHGIVLTGWFVWLMVQTGLIALGRTDLHRWMGVIGVGLGVAVVVVGSIVAMNFAERARTQGVDLGPNSSELIITWQNFALLLSFSVFVSFGVALRRRADMHKRLMILASVSLISPAIARIARWTVLGGQGVATPVPGSPLIPTVVLTLLLALVLHDVVSRKRVHTVTVAGGLFFVLTLIGAAFVANTDTGRVFVYGQP